MSKVTLSKPIETKDLESDEGNELNFCPECGRKLNGSEKFCPGCGTKLK